MMFTAHLCLFTFIGLGGGCGGAAPPSTDFVHNFLGRILSPGNFVTEGFFRMGILSGDFVAGDFVMELLNGNPTFQKGKLKK